MPTSGDPRQPPLAERGPPGSTPATPRRSVTGLVAVALVAAAALAVGSIVLLLLSAPAKKVDRAVGKLLAPPSPRVVAGPEIVFGMAAPFSGANRELGRAMKAGIEAAFAAANAAGGVAGRTLRLVALDDGYEPSRTGLAMKQLVDVEHVFGIVGNVGTPTAAVSAPFCNERKVVFFGALSGGDLLRRHPPDRYVFNYRASYAEETAAAVRYLVDVKRLSPARIAVFAQEDEFGESGWRGVAGELARRGVDLGRVVRVGYRRNTDDVARAVDEVRRRARDVEAVVMIATYKPAAAFIRKLRAAGLAVPTTNVSAVDANALAEDLVSSDRRLADGVVVTQVVPLPTSRAPAVLRFRQAMAKHVPAERPGFLSLEGWLVGNILVEALERAGHDLDTETLVHAFEGLGDLDLGIGARIAFGPEEHQGSHAVWGTLLRRDGTWRSIDLDKQ